MNFDKNSRYPYMFDKSHSINLKDYVSGGYFIVKDIGSSETVQFDSEKLLITMSRCLTNILPDTWAIDWVSFDEKERKKKARDFQLAPYSMIKMIEYVTRKFEENVIGWPGVFYRLEDCIYYADKFLSNSHDINLIGIGLHNTLVQKFLDHEKQLKGDSQNGICKAISKNLPLNESDSASKSEILGYEVLGYDYGDFHSWVCNDLLSVANQEFGITLNEVDLIDKFDDAYKVANYIGQDSVGAEPGLWLPWLLVRY